MADKKISDLPALTVADDSDLFAIVDVSGNITKKVTRAGLVPDGSIGPEKLSLVSTNGDWTIINFGAVKILSCLTASRSTSTGSASQTTAIPAGIISNLVSATASATSMTGEARVVVSVSSASSTGVTLNYATTAGSGTARAYITVIGTP